MPVLLTIGQVAAATGLCPKTIRRRIADGTLRAHRVGPRAIRIDRDSLTHLLQPVGAA
ncbi:helix-turn-helix transcriptional regulator [Mycobacterium haemophilum]|nr:helix-turn-helix domain-containing protein [Mycobacterium haemophilum]MCV7341592.1 helix-turn-helix domain-containing protein [Mycobacterium haemophilum DSM 44634]